MIGKNGEGLSAPATPTNGNEVVEEEEEEDKEEEACFVISIILLVCKYHSVFYSILVTVSIKG